MPSDLFFANKNYRHSSVGRDFLPITSHPFSVSLCEHYASLPPPLYLIGSVDYKRKICRTLRMWVVYKLVFRSVYTFTPSVLISLRQFVAFVRLVSRMTSAIIDYLNGEYYAFFL